MTKPGIDPLPVTLAGRCVRLEPMRELHLERLVEIGVGHDIFRWFPFAVATREDMASHVAAALAGMRAGVAVPFVTVLRATGEVVGSTSFLAIDRANRRLEIGATWLGVPWQRTACNTEAKYLQLRHCFEELGCVRVEFKTDALNARSRAALLRIGATEEGTFRNHMVCAGGRLRDSVYFSVIDSEWTAVKRGLEAMLAAATDGPSDPR
jgi:RimJ/RimL family protein N-acetyltransferase